MSSGVFTSDGKTSFLSGAPHASSEGRAFLFTYEYRNTGFDKVHVLVNRKFDGKQVEYEFRRSFNSSKDNHILYIQNVNYVA